MTSIHTNRLHHLLDKLHGYSTQLCICDERNSYTYGQVLDEMLRWHSRFEELKVTPGTVIGIRTDYSVQSVAALLALIARRAVVALIPRDRVVTEYMADACAESLLEFQDDGKYQWHPHEGRRAHPLLERLRSVGEGGIVLFTSGSTGRPKAALQSIEGFLYKFRRPGRRFRTLAFLLLDHVAGLDTLFYTLANGGTLILTRRRDPLSILEIIQRFRVEVLPASPSFFRLLCAMGDHGRYDVSSLRIITYGSEPMDASTLTRLNGWFRNAQISQKYGTTETGSPRTVSRGSDSLWLKLKSDGIETKIINDVLWLRGEGTMLGYLNAPSPLDEQGWYCTGDLVEVDGEWIRFRGRAADIINVGGEKIAPAEIEALILQLDFVSGAIVTGVPHVLMGQVVTARVSLVEGSLEPKEAAKLIRLHCRKHHGTHSVPVDIQIVTGALTTLRQKARRSP